MNFYLEKLHGAGILFCFIIACFGMAYWGFYRYDHGPKEFRSTHYSNFEESSIKKNNLKAIFQLGASSKPETALTKDRMLETLKNRKSDYIKNIEGIASLLRYLAAFAILGLLILFYRPDSFKIPIVNVEVPNTLFHLFVAIGLLYLWIQFGLSLNAGIDSRLALHGMITELETSGTRQVVYQYSDLNTLVDYGILDTWTSWYYDLFKNGENRGLHHLLSFLGLFMIFGLFWGAIHAICLTLISTLYETKLHATLMLKLFYWFVAFMLTLASFAFVWEFEHASMLLAWVWLLAAVMMWMWNWWGRDIAEESIQMEAVVADE